PLSFPAHLSGALFRHLCVAGAAPAAARYALSLHDALPICGQRVDVHAAPAEGQDVQTPRAPHRTLLGRCPRFSPSRRERSTVCLDKDLRVVGARAARDAPAVTGGDRRPARGTTVRAGMAPGRGDGIMCNCPDKAPRRTMTTSPVPERPAEVYRPRVHLDRTSPVPLYHQIASVLQEAIVSGEIAAHTRIEN